MIRLAEPADRPALEALYRACFFENGLYTAAVFDALFEHSDLLLSEADGRPVSMCFLVPFVFSDHGHVISAQYLYAACTDENYRARGLMAAILHAADETACRCGRAFTFLVPASDSLFSYYARHGYRTVFHRALVAPGVPAGKITGVSASAALELRERHLTEGFSMRHTADSFRFLEYDAMLTNGAFLGLSLPHGRGYAVLAGPLCRELCCDSRDIESAAALLSREKGIKQVFTSPFLYPHGARIPYAMAKSCGEYKLMQGYCNLCFD